LLIIIFTQQYPHRPLIFIAHSFGGLVVLKVAIFRSCTAYQTHSLFN
jgi:hypothetical protein